MIDPVLVDLHDITVRSALWWLLLPAIGLPVSITMYLRGQPGFLSRLIVWFGVVPVFLGAAHLGRWTFGALLAASAVWALWEAARLEEKAVRPTPLVLLGAVLAGGAPLVVAATAPVPWPPIIAGWLLAPAVYFLLPRAAGAVRILMAALYLGLGLAIWVQLLLLPAGYRFVLVAFSVVSVSDILALVAGRAFPRIVLFKRLSPGKTLAGYLGGGAAAVSVAFILWFALPELSGGQVLLTALLLGLGGMLGDLLASAIKRRHRVKDFGRALGRMGGVFDRLDSLLGAGGVFWLTMIFLSGDTMAIPEPTDALGHVTVIQTSRSGDRLTEVVTAELDELTATDAEVLELRPTERYQTLVGFGGSFTESTAHVLSRLSAARRDSVIDAYFAADGAAYSLTRTHINSCDFSLDHYAYVDDGDTSLASFSVNHDLTALIPLIQDAARAPGADFKIIASPWTAPPWMKDNDSWYGGSLRPDLADLWARYLVKYLDAYAEHGIEIWGLTPENEPLGNDGHWDSMHFTPQTMRDFIRDHLGPQLAERGSDTKLLIFDQNRDHVEHWAEVILGDPETARYVWGTAVHWYASTIDWFPEVLQRVHDAFPDKHLLHSEGCVDSQVPVWRDDDWYWRREATDWGYTWAPPEDRHLHPKYVPVYRYARDIIGGLNSWLTGWIDWNLVLDSRGGPNLAENWCCAPVLAEPDTDEVYFTPLYHVLAHFSRYLRPGAQRIGLHNGLTDVMATAVSNPDGSLAVVLLNQDTAPHDYVLRLADRQAALSLPGESLQTVLVH